MTPKKLDNKSVEGSKLNLEALYAIAPSCITEVKDPQTGKTRLAVNLDTLRTLLGDDTVETNREMYQFTWPGKQAARLEAAAATTETLRPVPEDSLDWDTTQNVYIEGDNLRVLKLLQKSYMGKVKMIYIDPPYNTGNDFVYNDDFKRTITEEELAAGNIDEEGRRYRKNTDSNGRFHSDWCSMMYSRLLVARNLLSEDGAIFISIDDNEVHNLRKICDEIFGAKNFLGIITWVKKRKGSFLSKGIVSLTEYVLVYTKDADAFGGLFGGYANEEESQPIIKRTNRISELSIPSNYVKTKLFDGVYPAGTYGERLNPVELLENMEVKDGVIVSPLKLRAPFTWSQDKLNDQIAKGARLVINTKNFQPRVYKVFDERDFKGISSLLRGVDYSATNEDAYEELEALLGKKKLFDYPKPAALLTQLISAMTSFKEDKDSLILDFFSGSATTAHAVMQLNAEDGGNRKYICVQLPEETPEESDARKADYTSIPKIAKARIRLAGEKIKEEHPEEADCLDAGFRVFRLDSSNSEEMNRAPKDYDQTQLDLFVDNIKDDRTDLDLLFGALLSWGVPLSLSQPLQTVEVDDCTIYNVTDGELVACFAEQVTEAVVRTMAKMKPERVLFRDSCFDEDKTKINIFEQLKQDLGWDEREALDNIRVI